MNMDDPHMLPEDDEAEEVRVPIDGKCTENWFIRPLQRTRPNLI